MFNATVNQKSFEIIPTEEGFLVNGESVILDMVDLGDKHFHIIYKTKSFRAEVVSTDTITKTVAIKINGNLYSIKLKNKLDLLLEKMGIQAGAAGKINSIKAPMPGLIIDLKVKEGDHVKTNDPLLILEAMKMENIIKSPGDGIVKSVKVQKGISVEKNQILIEF